MGPGQDRRAAVRAAVRRRPDRAASEQRSQLANRQAARARLAALLRDGIAPPQRPRVPTRPGRAANERRLQAKRNRAAIKRTRRHDSGDPD